ncbi:MAG TPA: CHRD domain-containing protein [Gaiellaceae bacterium]|nr:CHRD domain-containing protein [Gaiellaceae bacterium]
MLKAVGAAFLAALVITGLAAGAAQKHDTFKLSATLSAGAEVPKPKGVPAAATGSFSGKAVERANDKASLTWKLTFSHLSGKAVAAHIHLGVKGKPGNVIVPLCGPCRSGQTGKATITHAQLKKIEKGATYVNVHTKKNLGGEIRGQIKATSAD